jgi:hypothetical protein
MLKELTAVGWDILPHSWAAGSFLKGELCDLVPFQSHTYIFFILRTTIPHNRMVLVTGEEKKVLEVKYIYLRFHS